MYDRSHEKAKEGLTFVVSGMLWQRSLVMKDLETGSLWSHILGRGMQGELEGVELPVLPSEITTWKAWSEAQPESTLLAMSRTTRGYGREAFEDKGPLVYGIVSGEESWAVPLPLLLERGKILAEVGGTSFLVVGDPESGAARAYLAGEDQGGEAETESLEPAVGILSFRQAWEKFHPDSAYAE